MKVCGITGWYLWDWPFLAAAYVPLFGRQKWKTMSLLFFPMDFFADQVLRSRDYTWHSSIQKYFELLFVTFIAVCFTAVNSSSDGSCSLRKDLSRQTLPFILD